MAQRRRHAKEDVKLERITLMIPAELKAELDAEVEAGMRTLSDAVRQRLAGSLRRGAWADVEQQLASDARAFGRLASWLANELGYYSEPGYEAQDLKAAVGHLIDRMYGASKPGEAAGQAEMVAELWLTRVHNSRERTYENGNPIPMTTEQRALLEIRSDMATGRTTPSERPEEATTGGKVDEPAERPRKRTKAA